MYPPNIQRLIRRLNTPTKVQAWLKTLDYHMKDTMRTLPDIVRTRSVHCLEGALAAAAILKHHGYPPLLLDIDSKDKLGHVLFLYKRNGRYGTVGISRDIGLYGRRPAYRTIRSLVQSYAAPYIDTVAHITRYGTFDLRTLLDDRWRSSSRQVWYIERALIAMPHTKFHSSTAFVRHWRRRFLDFKKSHPCRQPDYFPNRINWL